MKEFRENDPEQLKKVISGLIDKTRILLGHLQEVYDKYQQVQEEKDFWKDSYFQLKEACGHYVQAGGITPFTYIASL